jgi:hypothetical protein
LDHWKPEISWAKGVLSPKFRLNQFTSLVGWFDEVERCGYIALTYGEMCEANEFSDFEMDYAEGWSKLGVLIHQK